MAGRPFPDPESEARFYEMAGRCIAAWAKVDDEAFRIFHACVGGRLKPCAVLYFGWAGISTRLNSTTKMVRATTSAAGLAAWKETIKNLEALSAVRNRIAHQHVASRVEWGAMDMFPPFGDLPLSGHDSEHWFEIAEGQHQAAAGREVKPPLRISDLEAHLVDVARLEAAVRAFCDDRLPGLLQEPS